jgi:hypothetical protein
VAITGTQISTLIEAELSSITESRIASHIRSLLVRPKPVMRAWDYGYEGEAYPCWSVLSHTPSNTGIAYCESGFGPNSPWGLVFLSGAERMSIGMDSAWFKHFLQAYFDCKASSELPIWRVFRQERNSYPGTPITEEGSWESTWQEVERLRSEDSSSRYHCSQSAYQDDA